MFKKIKNNENSLIFSLIIPVYKTNIEIFRKCLNSIANIRFNKDLFEVIIINDGMSNFKPYNEIIQKTLISNNIQSKLITNDLNLKQGYSRYEGLKIAKGEYIHFIDSDDIVLPEIYSILNQYKVDEPVFILFKEKLMDRHLEIPQNEVFDKLINCLCFEELKDKIFSNIHIKYLKYLNAFFLHSKVFNRKWLLKNTKSWIANLYAEDILLTMEIFIKTDKFKICDEKLYEYNSNSDSITANFDMKFFFDNLFVYDKILTMIKSSNRLDLKELLLYLILTTCNFYYYYLDNFKPFLSKILKKYNDLEKCCLSDYNQYPLNNKLHYDIIKKNKKLWELFHQILPESDLFFQKMIELSDDETVIPYVKHQNRKTITEKKYKINDSLEKHEKIYLKESVQALGLDLETLFLSAVLFTLTKVVYNKKILITKLYKRHNRDNNAPSIERIIFAYEFDTSMDCITFFKDIQKQNKKIMDYKDYFQNVFKDYNNIDLPDFQFYYEEDTLQQNDNIPESNFTIIINCKENMIKVVYNDSLYSFEMVDLFVDNFLIVLKNLIYNRGKYLSDISIYSDSNEYDFVKPTLTLNKLFEEVFCKNDDKIALIDCKNSLTFNELNQNANKIANFLIKNGLEIEDRVIIKLEKSINLIISVFGVIKAGGTFIIIDIDDPDERINLIKEDANAKYIIDKHNISSFLQEKNENNPEIDLNLDNIFWISYTSGSTGKPKGVMVTHKSEACKLKIEEYDIITTNDTFLLMLKPIFNLFIKDLFIFLFKGLTIIIPNDTQLQNPLSLLRLYEFSKFNIITTTPSRLSAMLENFQNVIKKMKVIILGGEILTKQFLDRIKKVTNARIFNIYGLSEDSGHCNVNILLNNNEDSVSVGKPILNVVEKIVDIDGNPLPPGMIGELWVGGPGITKGYWNQLQLTKNKYINMNNIHFFKTGDIASRDKENNYYIMGRIDNQIKLRGQIINPAEIKNNIPQDIGVEKTVIITKQENDEEILCLYFTTTETLTEKEISKIKNKMKTAFKNTMPNFMIPQSLIYLDEFPRTKTDKVDYYNLPKPSFIKTKKNPPLNKIEKTIFKMAQDYIGHNNFNANANLISIGFTSLLLLKLISKVSQKYNTQINLNNLYENISIHTLSNEIKNSKNREKELKPNTKNELYPLTPQQLTYLADDMDNPLKYNIPYFLKFKNTTAEFVKKILEQTIDLNIYMKTYFVMKNNKIYQKRNDKQKVDIKIYDKNYNVNFNEIIELFKYPLFKVGIIPYNKEEIIVFFNIHHIITDAFSIEYFHQDLLNLYLGNKVPTKKFNYYDYSIDLLKSEKQNIAKASKYLKEKLKKNSLLKYMNTIPKKTDENYSEKLKVEFQSLKIKVFIEKYNISYNILFLSSTILSLSKFLNNENIFLEYIFNGRETSQYSNTIGLFRRHIPLFFNLDPKNELMNHVDYIKSELEKTHEIGSNSLFEDFILFFKKIDPPKIVYNFHQINKKSDDEIEVIKKDNLSNFTNEMIISVYVEDTYNFSIEIVYDKSYFTKIEVEELSNLIKNCIMKIISKPNDKIGTIL